MKTALTHKLHDYIELQYQEQTLFRYVYEPETAQVESPRPYFHPLRTLAGNKVSIFRPYDHVWHIGLSMTSANLSSENFWGGPTFVKDKGYVQLDNNGRVQHSGWGKISCDERLHCIEQLQWINHEGSTWINEEREISVNEIDQAEGYWSLDLSFKLLNVSGHPLLFGSPTTAGRPMAGYGGLFWRGPRSFLRGKVLLAGSEEGDPMGAASPWLAFSGRHDGTGDRSTLLFLDQPTNPRFPNKWFVRSDPFAAVSCAFMFDEVYTLPADETLALSYRVVLANGEWSRERIEAYVAQTQSV